MPKQKLHTSHRMCEVCREEHDAFYDCSGKVNSKGVTFSQWRKEAGIFGFPLLDPAFQRIVDAWHAGHDPSLYRV